MTASTPLDVSLDKAGLTLIEASAGSGKTRAITTLVARLVVERGLELDRFLVVTFTRAATAELKERIRRTLKAAYRAIDQPDEEDDQARELLERWRHAEDIDLDVARRRLDLAVHDIDRANVHTIHGICARLLAEFSFECGLPFGLEVKGAGDDSVMRATHDFWRSKVEGFSPGMARYMHETSVSPGSLAQWAARVPLQPGLEVWGVDEKSASPEQHEADWTGALSTVRELWKTGSSDFHDVLFTDGLLNRTSYPEHKIKTRLRALERRMGDPEDVLWPAEFAAWFGRERLDSALRKGKTLPDNPLFEAFDQLEKAAGRLRLAYGNAVRHLRKDLLEAVKRTRRRLVREKRHLGYHDLLVELHAALEGSGGNNLARILRAQYPVALIDEYQDTDPLQARIFTRIYEKSIETPGTVEPLRPALFIVGDPKQSIYWFRGADVFSYLDAKGRAEETLTLDRNWRSAPALVEAVNVLFRTTEPFLLDSIEFTPAVPGRDVTPRLDVAGDDGPPVRLWRLNGETKSDATVEAARATANEIHRLLALAGAGCSLLDDEPLKGSDIAVLVRTRYQGREVVKELRLRGVRCVEIDDASVYNTREAEQLERLLWALAEPGRETRERTSLSGDIFGLDNSELLALSEDDNTWNDWFGRFGTWRRIWRSRGIGATLRHIVETSGGPRGLASYGNAARRLSNIRHLTEILHDAEAELRLGPAGLATWFSRQRSDERDGDDATQLRLESDEDLVKVMTIHGSKGLEFPVVFCPFSWDYSSRRASNRDSAAYHLDKDGGYPIVFNLDPGPGDLAAEAVEVFMEELRLLYVALTRARERCVIAVARMKRTGPLPPLAWLLHQGEAAGDDEKEEPEDGANPMGRAVTIEMVARLQGVESGFKRLTRETWTKEVERFVAASSGTIEIEDHNAGEAGPGIAPRAAPAETLEARQFTRKLRRIRQITSFTALSADHGPRDRVQREHVGRPDHDEGTDPPDTGDDDAGTGSTPFAFPRGTTSGRCLHSIFEAMDLRPDDDLDAICLRYLRHYSLGQEWKDVARAIVVNTRNALLTEPGHDGFRLGDPLPRLPEMEFHFPAEGLQLRRISECLKRHGYPDPIPASPDDEPIDGFLRGFIDLVIAKDGRWYVLDYKSNWLGNHARDYVREMLDPAMHRRGYTFQYLIYLVALDRYLSTRLEDYDYERHMGGAFYLFLRGIDPDAGMARGVYFDRPTQACIRDLDNCFRAQDT